MIKHILSFLLVFLLVPFVRADWSDGCFGPAGYGMMGGYSWMYLGWFTYLLFLVLIILGIIWLIRELTQPQRRKR